MTDLPLLISTLEEAGEGSRELDARIARALGAEAGVVGELGYRMRWAPWHSWSERHWHALPPYTSRVDAALALIGERLPGAYGRFEPRFYEPEDVRWIGYTIRPHWDRWSPVSDEWFDVSEARAATPALALCLALLKAIHQGETHDA